MDFFMDKDAVISKDREYRYWLWRRWDKKLPDLGVVMLNPSTADASDDDLTIKKLLTQAQRWGYGGIHVVNLFGLRATDPRAIGNLTYPRAVGPENDAWIGKIVGGRDVLLAWSNPDFCRHFLQREEEVKAILRECGPKRLLCISLTGTGRPSHPSRAAYTDAPNELRRGFIAEAGDDQNESGQSGD